MRKFLKNIMFFGFGLIVLINFVCILTNVIFCHNANFKFSGNPKYLIVGHSHAECTYNDSLILSSRNIASSGEPYFYSFVKMKEVLKENPSIEAVFLEFTNNQLTEGMDHTIFEEKYISKFYPKYGGFFSNKERFLLFKRNPTSFITSLGLQQKRNLLKILGNDYDMTTGLGGYVKHTNSAIDKAIQMEKPKKNYKYPLTFGTNLQYLDSIVGFCKRLKKDVIFLRSPQHELLSVRNNEEELQNFYKNHFDTIPFLDFNNYQLPLSYYKDLGHLNKYGATVISKKLDSLIRMKVIDSLYLMRKRHMIFVQDRNKSA